MTYTALITVSTSGIGKALAEKMAQQGHHLILVSRDSEKLHSQQKELCVRHRAHIDFIVSDLTTTNAAQSVFSQLKEKSLSIDILVNNAGFAQAGNFLGISPEKDLEMIHLHIAFTTQLAKLILPEMIEKRSGHILNVGSIASYIASPYLTVYAACKAYVLSFSKALRYETKDTGVSVSCLCPGPTRSNFAEKAGIKDTLLFKYLAMDARQVADAAYEGMMKNKKTIIPGGLNKLMVVSSALLPECIVNKILCALSKTKTSSK